MPWQRVAMTRVLAVDIGGTKLAVALVDERGGLGARRQVATPTTTDAEVLWDELAHLVTAVHADADGEVTGVSIASAGPLDLAAGTVSPVNLPAWRDFPLRQRIEDLTGVAVFADLDAKALALGEGWKGAAQGHDHYLAMVVSTGVGAGIVLDGRLLHGASGNAGHVGHMPVEAEGDRCPCGGHGCLETIASGPSVVRWAIAQGWAPGHPAPISDDGEGLPPPPTAADLAADAAAGDALARAAFVRAGRALGRAFASVAAVVDLDVVVVGGGVAHVGPLLFEPIAEGVAEAGLDFVRRLVVVPAALGPDAGLVGAAARLVDPERYGPAR